MNVSRFVFLLALFSALGLSGSARAVDLLAPGDFIIPIDLDIPTTASNFPNPGENPPKLFDGNTGTKYLNFGEENSGFIVTPAVGLSFVQSIRFTSANDAIERDPMTWVLYGTNAPITSANNSSGSLEPWVQIASGNTGLSTTRQTAAPVVPFANSAAYTSYRVLFPTVRTAATANSMQISEVQLYQEPDGTVPIIVSTDPVLGIDILTPNSSSPGSGNENVGNILDGVPGTKYLNFGEQQSGFIVSPDALPTIVNSFVVTTAGDATERDPATWELYGTNDAITSYAHSRGINENWTLIDSGAIDLPLDRLTVGAPVAVDGVTPYLSYRLVFPTVRNGATANSMQIADVQFQGSVVPEPSTWALAATGLFGLGLIRRKRKA